VRGEGLALFQNPTRCWGANAIKRITHRNQERPCRKKSKKDAANPSRIVFFCSERNKTTRIKREKDANNGVDAEDLQGCQETQEGGGGGLVTGGSEGNAQKVQQGGGNFRKLNTSKMGVKKKGVKD